MVRDDPNGLKMPPLRVGIVELVVSFVTLVVVVKAGRGNQNRVTPHEEKKACCGKSKRRQMKDRSSLFEGQDIGERGKPPYDATYANGPVNYVKLDRLPAVDDTSPIINAMKRGDYFVTSGEVLISSYAVEGTGEAWNVTPPGSRRTVR